MEIHCACCFHILVAINRDITILVYPVRPEVHKHTVRSNFQFSFVAINRYELPFLGPLIDMSKLSYNKVVLNLSTQSGSYCNHGGALQLWGGFQPPGVPTEHRD